MSDTTIPLNAKGAKLGSFVLSLYKKDNHLAKPNYQNEKRQRDLAKKKKQEKKKQNKLEKKQIAAKMGPDPSPGN
ncbi:MAG: hypothetical protein HY282_17945 [Nitrospirae bacterium]|nr:hypothetical protein [Candidatus Manganitrophaceae bacterium]